MPETLDRNTEMPRVIGQLGDELEIAFARAAREERIASTPPPRPRRARRRGFAIAFAAAVIAAVIAVVIPLAGRDPSGGVLTVQEAVAEITKGVFAAPGPIADGYLHTVSRETLTGGDALARKPYAITVRSERQTWQSSRRTGWTSTRLTGLEFPTARDRAGAESAVDAFDKMRATSDRSMGKIVDMYAPIRSSLAGRPPADSAVVCRVSPKAADFMFGTQSFGPGLRRFKISNDPARLHYTLSHVVRGLRPADRETWVWNRVDSSLRSGAPRLEPKQRASLVGVLAFVPGVTTIPGDHDPNGRPAIGFQRTAHHLHQRIYFDPRTSLVTYSDSVTTGTGPAWKLPPNHVYERYELLDFARVAEPPANLKPTSGAANVVALTVATAICPQFGTPGE